MSVGSTLAFALAERALRVGGPRAGLLAFKPLTTSLDGDVRAKSILACLRCALTLRDGEALDALTSLWPSAGHGIWDAPIASLCKEMVRSGLRSQAVELARAEATRHPSAISLYLHARCVDLGSADATELFRRAVERAEREGQSDIALVSRVRCIALLSRSWTTMQEAIEEARRVDLSRAASESKLVVARTLLFSASRFTRAGAVGTLDELVVGDDPSIATRALVAVARWADDVGGAITPLELDRVTALLSRPQVTARAPTLAAVAGARARIVLRANDLLTEASRLDPALEARVSRARDITRGRFEVVESPFRRQAHGLESEPYALAHERWARHIDDILDVAVALRDGAPRRAAGSLRGLLEAEERGERLPSESLVVAHAALVHEDRELRDVGGRWFEARLRSPRAGAPPRGYLALAEALAAMGKVEAAGLARHAAVVTNEPGAVDALGTAALREGWELARSGDRDGAIAALRAAKAQLEGSATAPGKRSST